MPSISTVRADNAAFSPSYLPVALFVGGTSGIGQATAQALARHTKGEVHIIICGRNRAAAESIFTTFPKSPKSCYEFIECDVSLLKNVQVMTTKLLSTLPKLNFLVLSAGFLNLQGRIETSEGKVRKLVTDYYSRWKFTNDLMPLLRKARDAGESAKVLSVFAAARGKPINWDDLNLKDYSVLKEVAAAATYNDVMIESFSDRQPDMAFTHMYPGFVRTPLLHPDSWIYMPLYWLLICMTYFSSYSMSDSGEYHLHALLQGENGWFRRGPTGELVKMTTKNYFTTEEVKKKLWDFTVEMTTVE